MSLYGARADEMANQPTPACASKMRLCPHRRVWLVEGHTCCCEVLDAEWDRRRTMKLQSPNKNRGILDMSRFTKIGADGAKLDDAATEWAAVLDNTTGLLWSVEETKRLTWKKAAAAVSKLDTAGFTDWRLPTVEELFLLADRTKLSPAIDTAYFPDCKSDWYWTSTPLASSPSGCAWGVFFYYGSAFWLSQNFDNYVRAVRASQS